MTSIYDNTVCEVKRQMPIPVHPFPRSSRRGNYRMRTKAHPFRHTDWEELLKREWNKRTPPLSPLEWREKHARNTNAEDCCEFLMGRRCGRRRRLLFRSGYYLTIQPDGSVKGTKQKDCPYGKFTFCSFVYSIKKKYVIDCWGKPWIGLFSVIKTDVWTTWADVNIRRIAFDESCLGSAANNNTTNWNTQQFCHSNVIKFDWQKAFLVRELLLGGGGEGWRILREDHAVLKGNIGGDQSSPTEQWEGCYRKLTSYKLPMKGDHENITKP